MTSYRVTKYAPAVVVGAGVGGMATAILLARSGAEVTLVERGPGPALGGAALLLQPNGLAVLDGLGVSEALHANGNAFKSAAVRRADGTVLAPTPIVNHGPGLDHVLAVRRRTLMAALFEAVEAEPLITTRFGARVTHVDPEGAVTINVGNDAEVLFANVVVGADGVHSTVRDFGVFDATLRDTGTSYFRAIVDGDHHGLQGEHWTSLGLLGGAPLGDGTTYFYAAAHSPAITTAVQLRDLAAIRKHWATALPMSASLWDGVESFDDLLINPVTRVDARRWHDRRLVLVGDAAHAMAPTLGQGANSALVDAAILVSELSSGVDVESAARMYTARRRRRVRKVQVTADRVARLSDFRNPIAVAARDLVLKLATRSASGLARQEALAQQEDPGFLRATVRELTAHAAARKQLVDA